MKWIVVVVQVGVAVFFGSYMYEALCSARGGPETPKTGNIGIRNSWRMQEQPAQHWWLAPILQNTPSAPAKSCIRHAERPCWVLLLRAHEAKHLLRRLRGTKEAWNGRKVFSRNVMWFGVFYVFLALGLYATKLLFFTFVFPNILSSLPTRYWETVPDDNSGKERDPAPSSSCL